MVLVQGTARVDEEDLRANRERYWREARLMKIAPVSQEMICNYISTQVLGLPKSY